MNWVTHLLGYFGEFSQILLMRLYAALASFLLTILLGRLLGPAEFGAYAFALSWVSFAILFTTLGFHHFTIRAVPPLIVDNKLSEASGIVIYAAAVIICLSAATTGFVLLNPVLFSQDAVMQGAVAVACLLLIPRSLGLLRTGVLQGLGHPVAGQVPERLIEPTLLLVAVGLWAVSGGMIGAQEVLYLTLLVVVVSLLLGMRRFVRALNKIRVRPSFSNFSFWTIGALKSSLVFAAGTVLGATDVVMLGLLSTPEETGIYGIAVRFFLLMGLPFHATAVFLSQRAAKMHARNDTQGLKELVRKAAVRTILSSIALAVPSTMVAFFVVDIFGAGFAPASAVILLLVWTRVGLSFFGEPAALLANTQHVGWVSIVMAVTALANIALNAVLVVPYGSMGAAIATVISYSAMTLVLTKSIRSRLGIDGFHGLRPFRLPDRNKP